jgi:hypothetical protein
MQQHHDDHRNLLPEDQRCREIADILAAGILRLRSRAALPTAVTASAAPEKPADSSPNGLEVPDKTRLSGHTG